MQAFTLTVGRHIARVPPVREELQRAGCAFGNASGRFPAIDSLDAEAAFSHGMLRGTEFRHMEGTALYAVAATDASASDMLHDAIGSAPQRSRGTGGGACRIAAMEACGRNGQSVAVREFTGNMRFNPAQLLARRRIILQLAGHLTRVATDAFLHIKYNQRFHVVLLNRKASHAFHGFPKIHK
jgi:hypothetical protein